MAWRIKRPDPKSTADEEADLRVVDSDSKVYRLEAGESPSSDIAMRPSQPKMELLKDKDLEAFRKLEDAETPWLEEDLDTEAQTIKIPMGWYILSALVFLSLGIWGGWRLLYGNNINALNGFKDQEEFHKEGLSAAERAEETHRELADAEVFYEKLENVLRSYFMASKPEDFIGVIRHEERVMPLVREYYQTHPFEPKEFKSIEEFHTLALGNKPMIGMRVNFKNAERRPALAEETPDGIRIDWESERAYQPVDLTEYIRTRPTEPVELRVYVRLDNYYAYEFANEEKYLSLKLTFRDSDESLVGYLERGSVVEEEIQTLLEQSRHRVLPMVLRVKFLEGGRSSKSVLVEKLVSHVWAYIDDPSKKNTLENSDQ